MDITISDLCKKHINIQMTQTRAKLETSFWQIQVCTTAFGHNADVFLLEKTIYLWEYWKLFWTAPYIFPLIFFASTFASTKKCSISWCFTHWVDTGLDSTGLSDAEPKTQSKIQVRTQSLICLDMDYVIHASHPHDVSSIPVQKLVFPVHHVLCSDCTIWSHGGRQPVSAELLYAGFSLHKVVCSESTLHVGPRVYQPRSEPSSLQEITRSISQLPCKAHRLLQLSGAVQMDSKRSKVLSVSPLQSKRGRNAF